MPRMRYKTTETAARLEREATQAREAQAARAQARIDDVEKAQAEHLETQKGLSNVRFTEQPLLGARKAAKPAPKPKAKPAPKS